MNGIILELSALLSIIVCYLLSRKTKHKKRNFLISAGILLVLIFGSRYYANWFPDEAGYYAIYGKRIGQSFTDMISELHGNRDEGFIVLFWLLAKIFPWNQACIYIITATCIFSFFRFIYKNCEDEFLAVILFLTVGWFTFYMAGYRQTFAMAFCLFAFEFAKKRKPIRYLICCLLAFTIHASSIIFLPTYIFMNIKRTKAGVFLWIVILALLLIFEKPMLELASDTEYFDRDYRAGIDLSVAGFVIQIIIMLTPFVLDILRVNIWDKKSRTMQFNDKIMLSTGIALYASKVIYLAFERLSYYYTFTVIAAFSNSIAHFDLKDGNDKIKKVIYLLIILACLALYVVRRQGDLVFFWTV